MKIEAVIVCIGYDDFLSITLPNNKQFFDKTVVVTSKSDKKTQSVCEKYNVQCVKTDSFYEENSKKPNKARGINEGLKYLSKDGWVLQLDADIWLPTMFRQIIQSKPLNINSLYGIDRLMCNSYEEWMEYIYFQKPMHEGWVYLHLHHFSMGQRIVKYNSHGYMPIGFFQLWNPKGSNIYKYPDTYNGFDRTDLQFAHLFDRQHREFIPDFACIHLASQKARMGENWEGRSTRRFLPEFLEDKEPCYKKVIKYFRRLIKRIIEAIKCLFHPPKPPYQEC